jgi:hypothetical protein
MGKILREEYIMSIDNKKDYLIRTFSRMASKRHENYIISAIWHKLNRVDIKPVTQQYVRLTNGKWSLLDLYFPQINFGIECDEKFHLGTKIHDLNRDIKIEEVLNSIEENSIFQIIHIDASGDIESINLLIDSAVSNIKTILENSKFKAWNIDELPSQLAIKNGQISINDGFQFKTIVDICRCFGRSYKSMQLCYFDIGNGYQIWCPKLAIVKGTDLKAATRGWLNILDSDWEKISESNENFAHIPVKHHERKRIVFAKSKDVLGRNTYRFIGVYMHSNKLSDKTTNIYERVSKSLSLIDWIF